MIVFFALFDVLFYISNILLQAKLKEREEKTKKAGDRLSQLYTENNISK